MPFTPLPTPEQLNPQNFQGPQNPFQQTLDPEAEASAGLAEEAKADQPQFGDPATAWFDTGPVVKSDYDPGDLDAIETLFARKFGATNPENLSQYIEMGDRLIQKYPHLAGPIKQRMRNMPTGAIKDEYVEKLQEAKQRRQIIKGIELQEFKRQQISANLPDGWEVGPDGKPMPAYKAKEAERKARREMRKDLNTINDSIYNTEYDISKLMLEGKTAEAERMQRSLSRMQRDKQDIYRDLGWTDDTPPEEQEEIIEDPIDQAPPYDGISPEKFRNLPMDELFAAGDEARSANDARYAAEDGAAGDESTPSASAPRMDARDQDMLRWAIANPSDLKAQRVLQVIQSKYRIQ